MTRPYLTLVKQVNHICAEIQYSSKDGNVHSDLCCEGDNPKFQMLQCPEYRKMLHAALDEWLNKSNGTGYFYVGDINEEGDDEEM
jgi:hypothetical protein